MTPTNVEIVERFLAGADDAFAALIDPEIEIRDYDLPDAGVYRGHEGLARYLAQWEEAFPDWDLALEETHAEADRVAAVFTVRARGDSGIETTRRNAIVFTLRDGRIVRYEYFTSPEQARAALTTPSSSG